MSTNKDDTLRQFCDVTGADEGRSKFFLESSNWQLEVALSSFYEHGGNVDDAPPHAAAASIPVLSDSDMESPPGSPLQPQKKKEKQKSNTKFATLNTLQQESSSEDEEARRRRDELLRGGRYNCNESCCKTETGTVDNKSETDTDNSTAEEMKRLKNEINRLLSENSELRKDIARLKLLDGTKANQGEAFYAGGSERSGQQILGPPGKGRKDIVTEMFKSVREHGAVVFEDEPSTTSRSRGAFSGVGYRLGQTTDDHEQVAVSTGQQASSAESVRSVRLRLYREGFTVDGGALRAYSDPAHAEFLGCIRSGEIPSELAGLGEVRVSLEDRRHEECPRSSQPRHQAFAGKGHLLGSPTPPTVGAPAAETGGADREANLRAAQDAVAIDEQQPTTTIQFRLADGSRLTGRFNHSHTVGDLATFVSRAEPAYQVRTFALLTAFPSRELNDPEKTLAQDNLLNTTLLQRLK